MFVGVVCYFSTHLSSSLDAVDFDLLFLRPSQRDLTQRNLKINTRLRSVSKSSSDLLGKCFQNFRRLLQGFASSQSAQVDVNITAKPLMTGLISIE